MSLFKKCVTVKDAKAIVISTLNLLRFDRYSVDVLLSLALLIINKTRD